MKKILIFLLINFTSFAQSSFNYNNDFKVILERTKQKNDMLFFEKQIKRFNVNDSTLTNFEVLALLIGFTSKPKYNPYSDITTEREIYKLNDDGKFNEALDAANKYLVTHPLSLKVIGEKSYSFQKLQKADSSHFYARKMTKIFKAMEFSGNGKSIDNPMFALSPADGQDYIRKFLRKKIGTMGSTSDKNENFIDLLDAKINDEDVRYYFIIEHAMATLRKRVLESKK